jgi:citrate lyase subunit beta / citryl-CoA lyase
LLIVAAQPSQPFSPARTFLIFPGDDPRKRDHALASEADAVVLDLEDGVAADAKDAARRELVAFTAAPGSPDRLVRVNDPMTDEGQRDLAAVSETAETVQVVVPKARIESVERAAELGRPIIALIEDAVGLRDAFELAEHTAVKALGLGIADLTASLGLIADGSGSELIYPRAQLVVASSAAGIRDPVDGPCLVTRDDAAIERDTRAARSLGMRGKFCIHPHQVRIVHRALAPTPAEVEKARHILLEWERMREEGRAVGVVDGVLIDLPVAVRAQAVVNATEGSNE